MSAKDLDLGGGLKLARLLEKGYAAYFEGRTFRILHGGTVLRSFSDSRGEILTQLRQKNAMTPSQISDVVGSTPAPVIYNLKPLIKAGVVERHPAFAPKGKATLWRLFIRIRRSPVLGSLIFGSSFAALMVALLLLAS
jgi:hypothetical protein